MFLRRPIAALLASLTLIPAAPAAAQRSGAALVAPMEPATIPTPVRRGPDFRMPDGDLRLPAGPRRNGLIAALPVTPRMDVGIGRFYVGEIAGPTNNMERVRQPMSVRGRGRAIAGVGFSLRFR
jgi:hypothetical protein